MMERIEPVTFQARTIRGAGRGKDLGTPTMNLDLRDVPQDLREGIYAGRVGLGDMGNTIAAIHYGPSPVFDAGLSFEVHALDIDIPIPPERLTVTLEAYLRPIMDFATQDDLRAQIAQDIRETRAIM